MAHLSDGPTNGAVPGDDRPDLAFWRTHTQISLQPVAAPSILGLFGFAASTFMVTANLAGWYGNDSTPLIPIGAIVLVASAGFAFYTATAMMLRGTFRRTVLPVGRPRTADRPGAIPVQPIQYEFGEPGVKVGR